MKLSLVVIDMIMSSTAVKTTNISISFSQLKKCSISTIYDYMFSHVSINDYLRSVPTTHKDHVNNLLINNYWNDYMNNQRLSINDYCIIKPIHC